MDDPERPHPLGPDPDDDYLLALAAQADAVLVTGDRALLAHAGGIAICSPARFAATVAAEGH